MRLTQKDKVARIEFFAWNSDDTPKTDLVAADISAYAVRLIKLNTSGTNASVAGVATIVDGAQTVGRAEGTLIAWPGGLGNRYTFDSTAPATSDVAYLLTLTSAGTDTFAIPTYRVVTQLDPAEADADAIAESVKTALLAQLDGEPISFVAAYNPISRALTLYEGVDYADGSIPGPLDIPMGEHTQYDVGDDVYLSLSIGHNSALQLPGEVVLEAGATLARLDDFVLDKHGRGTWELWHVNDDQDDYKAVNGTYTIHKAIQTPPGP